MKGEHAGGRQACRPSLQVPKQEGKEIGIDLGSRPGMACVTVLKVDPVIGEAASKAGLYAGLRMRGACGRARAVCAYRSEPVRLW